ncbi:MAG: glycoside hydrolase family 31 protein [Gemmatimonadaceae bacterium]
MRIALCALAAWIVTSIATPATAQSAGRVELSLSPDTAWWTGVVTHGQQMPVRAGYAADLRANTYGSQAQPLLLSNRGHVVWSDAPVRIRASGTTLLVESTSPITVSRSGSSLRDAFHFASSHYFPPSGRMPDSLLFTAPQYNSWIELMYDQNQVDLLRYATGVVSHGLPPGVLMIDDNWQEDYGRWRFHPGRFHEPRAMVDSLHALGFKVMLWVCPFVSPDADVYRELRRKGFLLRDASGEPAIVRWWNGASALLDLSNPGAEAWFGAQLDSLVRTYGVDGFKFDAGDAEYYVNTVAFRSVTPNEQSTLYGGVGLRYPLNEYRAMWKMGGQPLVERLRDKAHRWSDLSLLVPQIVAEGLSGHPFTCPDMIGGGEFKSFLNATSIDQELVVRWAQASALMPMMQFSAAPWRILDAQHFDAVKQMVKLRDRFRPYLLTLARDAAMTGEPIIRSLEYAYPHRGYAEVTDQFLLGDRVLVAPVMTRGATRRAVLLPPGRWRQPDGSVARGPARIEVAVGLNDLPYFELVAR